MNTVRKSFSFAFTLLSLTYLCACAVGPLVSHETARTVGANKNEFVFGAGQAGAVLKWNTGLTQDLDLGAQFESLSLGLRLKYAFVNNDKQGFSFASALGTGASLGGSHYYVDFIGSYLNDKAEPYTTLRLVRVKNDPLEFKNKDTGAVNFTIGSSQYEYGQFILGTRIWLSQNWMMSLEASNIFAIGTGFSTNLPVLYGVAFGYRF